GHRPPWRRAGYPRVAGSRTLRRPRSSRPAAGRGTAAGRRRVPGSREGVRTGAMLPWIGPGGDLAQPKDDAERRAAESIAKRNTDPYLEAEHCSVSFSSRRPPSRAARKALLMDLAHTTGGPATVSSAQPVVLPAPGPGEDPQVRVPAPAAAGDLPVGVLSHGFGCSMRHYGPLADHWAAHGFVVLQPTHLDSRTLALPPTDPRTPLIWRHRVTDLSRVLDGLDALEAAVPGLGGRVDR